MRNRNHYGIFFHAVIAIFCAAFMFLDTAIAIENNRENAVVKAVRQVSPAVVNISSEYEVQKRVNPFGFGDPFFDSFFRDFFDPGFDRRYKKTSLGSGVIIDGKKGLILTNAHVIQKAGKISVMLMDEREFEAQIIGADVDTDLAVLRITEKTTLPSIEMGNSDDLMIGETVIAIGNPFGFSHTVTTGVLSAINRSLRTEDHVYHDFIQTDASINPGNSGGPLLNINGELIGINTAIYASGQGIGFAIPINKAKRIIKDLISYGEKIDAWIGIRVQDVDPRLAQYKKIPQHTGVVVKSVETDSPAHQAGIRESDIILRIGNGDIYSVEDFNSVLRGVAVSDTLVMKVWRDGKSFTVSMVTKEFPLERAAALAYQLLGIKVNNISSKDHKRYGVTAKEGVMISEIHPNSSLAKIGVHPGDVIRQLDDIVIKNTNEFEKGIVKYLRKNSLVILLQRNDQGYYITVKF